MIRKSRETIEKVKAEIRYKVSIREWREFRMEKRVYSNTENIRD